MGLWRKKDNRKYRILSIDGGGMKGVFTAYAIWKLEDEYGIKILDHFDMIVGTSTGALIAAGLIEGKPSKEIYETYIDKNNPIFSQPKTFGQQITSTFYAGFETDALEEEIRKEFGDMKLTDLHNMRKDKEFAFFSTNFTKAKPLIYCSPNLKKGAEENMILVNDATMFEALRSSSAAPFYFEPLIRDEERELIIDGGLWANNPSLAAISIVLSNNRDLNVEQIEVLSFGQSFTDDVTFKLYKGKDLIKNPLKNQIVQLLMSVLVTNLNSQTELVEHLLKDNHYRYSPETEQKDVSVDKVSTKFNNYTKIYWQHNKESLVEFIKTGKNTKK